MSVRGNVVLIGPKHVGKTSVMRYLMEQRGWQGIDMDEWLVTVWNTAADSRSGRVDDARGIYCQIGTTRFRALERSVARLVAKHVLDLSMSDPSTPVMVATGGGIVENPRAMWRIKRIGHCICIVAGADTLFERIERGGLPPFLRARDGRSGHQLGREEAQKLWRRLHHRRAKRYVRYADVVIGTTDRSIDEIAEKVAAFRRWHALSGIIQ